MLTELDRGKRSSAEYFQPRRLGHVNLWASHLDVSEDFYKRICGLRVEFTEPGLKASFLGTGHTPHDLGLIEITRGENRYGRDGALQIPAKVGKTPGLNHLAWELSNEAELVDGFERLLDDGHTVNATADHQVAHSIYIMDPDRNRNEFYTDVIKDWRSKFSGPMDLITSRWDPSKAERFTDARYDDVPVLNEPGEGLIQPWRLTHAVLYTAQLEAMEQFYVDVAGLRVLRRQERDGRRVVYLRGGLNAYEHGLILVEADQAGFGHSAFQIRDEQVLAGSLSALSDANAIVVDRTIDTPWKRSFFLRDPDGMRCEFYVRREPAIDLRSAVEGALEYLV